MAELLIGEGTLLSRKVVLFDIDGTLLSSRMAEYDEGQRYIRAIRDITGKYVSVTPSRFAGMVDPQICRMILSENGISEKMQENLLPKVIVRMGEIYKAMKKQIVLNTGVQELLRVLLTSRSHVLGVLTGNVSCVGEEKLSVAGIRSYFTDRFYADSCFDRSVLAKSAVEACVSKYRLFSQEDVLIVGDTPLDIESANAAKAKPIGIASGVYSIEDLSKAGANSVFHDLSPSKELLGALGFGADD